MMNIGEPTYWEARYQLEFNKMVSFKLFDWYCPFSQIYPMVESVIEPKVRQKILILGVGRSDIIETLYG